MRSSYGYRSGSAAKFTDYHLWKALMTLDPTTGIGRKRLSEELGIGEGSTRTLLSVLERNGCTFTNKTGIYLSEEGVKVRNRTIMDVAHLSLGDLTISDCDCAVRIPFAAKKIRYGKEETDAAIKNGAAGATTLVYTDGRVRFPGTEQLVDSGSEDVLRRVFRLRADDVIIVGTARTPEAAEMGAVSVALALVGGIRFGTESGIMTGRSNDELVSMCFAVHELVGGLPVCAKRRNNLGIRIEDGMVIDNVYDGEALEEAIQTGRTVRKVAESGPYKGIRVICTPIDVDGTVIAAIGVVDMKELFSVHIR